MGKERSIHPGSVIDGIRIVSYCERTSNSQTFFGLDIKTRKQVVVKVHTNKYDMYMKEIEYLNKFNSPFILKPLKTIEFANNKICTVFPRALEKDLLNYINNVPEFPLSEKLVRDIAFVLFKSVEYLNSMGVMHRDYKPENVVIMNSNPTRSDIKVIDLGLACEITNHPITQKIGTELYAAPEVVDGNYSKECDIYSIGVTLCVACVAALPFDYSNSEAIYKSKKEKNISLEGDLWENFSPEFRSLISKCLEPDPKKRIDIETIFTEYAHLFDDSNT